MKNQFSITLIFILIFSISSDFAQEDIDQFLKNQPIIDMHFHITKGFDDNETYNQHKSFP